LIEQDFGEIAFFLGIPLNACSGYLSNMVNDLSFEDPQEPSSLGAFPGKLRLIAQRSDKGLLHDFFC
jgi:hypothetical protein